jgi:hypothetical protein
MAEDDSRDPLDEVSNLTAELGLVQSRWEEVSLRLDTFPVGNEYRALKAEQADLERRDRELLNKLARTAPGSQNVIVAGHGNVTINSGESAQRAQSRVAGRDIKTGPPTTSDRRAEFVYGSYEDERKEAKLTFWLSLGVASVAAVFALSAAGVALFHGGDQSTKWVATFVSTAVAVAGGVWHKHARDARAKVSKHVERVEKQVEADDHYERTNARIDRIQNPEMRDRANVASLVAELGFEADPNTLTDRVIGSSATAPELPPADESASERPDPS